MYIHVHKLHNKHVDQHTKTKIEYFGIKLPITSCGMIVHIYVCAGCVWYSTCYFHMQFSFPQNATSFLNGYEELLQQPQYQEYSEFGVVGVAYDAMWSIAIGLDIASKKIADGNDSRCEHLYGELVPLEMFNYSNVKLGCIMRKSYDEVMFTGITVSLFECVVF